MEIQCRACTSSTSSEYMDFISTLDNNITYLDYFNQLTQLQAGIDDGLPNTFCTNCCHDMQVSYEFTQVAKQADEAFKQNQQVQIIKSEAQDIDIDFIQEENEYQIETNESNENENENDLGDMEHEENIQISIVSAADVKNQEKHINLGESVISDEHDVQDDMDAEEIIECEEEVLSEETIQFDEVDIDGLDDFEELENSDEKLQEILKDTQKDLKEVMGSLDNDEYYPDDENDEEYLIEYDPNDLSMNTKKEDTSRKWKCIECKKILRGDVSFEGHMNMHKDVRPYVCSQCQCAFRCKISLQRHTHQRHNMGYKSLLKNICKYCKKKFKSSEDLKTHICEIFEEQTESLDSNAISGEETVSFCPYCKLKLNKEILQKHIRSSHLNEYQKDAKTFSTELFIHNSSEQETLHCKFCNENFLNIYDIRCHMKEFHSERLGKEISYSGEPLEPCKICGKKLLKRNLAKHEENHRNPEDKSTAKFICAYCSREFKNSKSLNHHEKMHKGEQPDVIYVCGECDRQYNSETLLEQHRKQAHKERDHVCTICGNAFKLKNQLYNHMKLHLSRDIQCPQCDKKYARIFDLNVHMRTHTGELPFACHLCDKRFAIKVRLTYHLQKHYGVKHRCKECGAEFNSKQKLKAHSFKHTGMPYICELCNDHGFSNRDVFKRHLLRVHKTTMSDEDLRAMFQRNTGKTTKIQAVEDLNLEVLSSSSLSLENENPMKVTSVKRIRTTS